MRIVGDLNILTQQQEDPSAMLEPANDSEYRLTLRQADHARADFVAIESDLQFIMGQLARVPDRTWLSRMLLLGLGTVWALIAAVVLMMVR